MKCELHFSLTMSREGRSSKMSEWSKAAADRFRKKARFEQEQAEKLRREEHAKNEKAILDSNNLKLNASKMWDDLCNLFAAKCEEFNLEGAGTTLKSLRLDPNTLELRRDELQRKLVFDPQRYVIAMPGLEGRDIPRPVERPIEIKVKNGSELGYFRGSTLVPAERIVESFLDDLLGGI
jgi:hypothetical protein